MKIRSLLLVALLTCAALGLAAPQAVAKNKVFTGAISDSACGLHHMMAGASAKKCTLECVGMGGKFVLADQAAQKVYGLSDQTAARPYAGENVQVTGTLKNGIIQVTSIQPLTKASK